MKDAATENQLIIVLGMHRSGTSAITRGLIALGAETGDDLMPAVAGDNDKGFWEDREFNTINVAVLHALGHDWHTLAPIADSELQRADLSALKLRALDFLRDRCTRYPVFAMKDPRASRLLPFWQPLFAHLELKARYVIALRHPISVARSLETRNGIAPEKSHQLWLEHLVDALHHSERCPRLIVDYDALIDNAGGELQRIAQALELSPVDLESARVREFIDTFLEARLRHSHFDAHDLQVDAAASPLLCELYANLARAARDEIALNDDAITQRIARCREFLQQSTPLLKFSYRTEMQLFAARDTQQRIDAALSDMSSAREQLEKALSESRQQLENRTRELQLAEEKCAVTAQLSQQRGENLESAQQNLNEQRRFAENLQQQLLALAADFQRVQSDSSANQKNLELMLEKKRQHIETLRTDAELQRKQFEALAVDQRELNRLREQHIVNLEKLVELRGEIDRLGESNRAYRGEIEHFQQRVTEIDDLRALLAEARSNIASMSEQISALQRALNEADKQKAACDHAIAEHINHINMMNCERVVHLGELEQAKTRLAQLETDLGRSALDCLRYKNALEETRSSHSWRMTAPARAAANIAREALRKIARTLSRIAHALYRALPLSIGSKQALKHAVFSSLGFLLRGSSSYRHWQSHQEYLAIQQAARASHAAAAPSAATNQPASVTNASFEPVVADGTSEWADYLPTLDRIRAIEKIQRDSAQISSFKMIDIGTSNYTDSARAIDIRASEQPLVSIIIPVFNHIKLTLECLLSISRFTGHGIDYEIIVANDASTDETLAVLSTIPNIRLSNNTANLGFLRNCNTAAKMARGKYVLFLNNDVQVAPGWLDAMIDVFRSEPDIGAVGPKIVYPSGHLQEAGVSWRRDGTAKMLGLADSPDAAQYSYMRDVDYCSGACLLLEADLFRELGGFDERFAPAYCEDADLCMQIHVRGLRIVYCPAAVIIHHLSKSSDALSQDYKLQCIAKNIAAFTDKWQAALDARDSVRVLAFYLPQFHPIPENDLWWGKGFTEWTNVTKAKPNFIGHYQPRKPADLGYYDLRVADVMRQQAALAKRYGIDGFCFYYYWFDGKLLLEQPLEHLLGENAVDMPFCLCWANENWTRRWDGRDSEVLMAQKHSDADDLAVIADLMRYFRSANYIRVNGKPLILVYRVTLFPDFRKTAALWRDACRKAGMGEIYITMVESFELVHKGISPVEYGCDAAVEFPPQELAEVRPPSGNIINPEFNGLVADYRDLAVRYATRAHPGYRRFHAACPGWDNTARRQNNGFCFEHATPGAFQAWLESAIEKTRDEFTGDERLVFINAWNERAEGAYLEPDQRYGHAFLEAVKNARESSHLIGFDKYSLGN